MIDYECRSKYFALDSINDYACRNHHTRLGPWIIYCCLGITSFWIMGHVFLTEVFENSAKSLGRILCIGSLRFLLPCYNMKKVLHYKLAYFHDTMLLIYALATSHFYYSYCSSAQNQVPGLQCEIPFSKFVPSVLSATCAILVLVRMVLYFKVMLNPIKGAK